MKPKTLMLGALTLGLCSGASAGDPNSAPNFLLMFTDDHGYGDVSAYHASDVRTLNIDRLGAVGMLFTTMRANLDPGGVACPERERIHRGMGRVLEIVGARPNCAMVTAARPFETPLDKLDNIRLSKDSVAN